MKVGILGGGQLARMLSLAGAPLGIKTLCYTPEKVSCASDVTDVFNGEYDDWDALQLFASKVDVITYETENIPSRALYFLEKQKAVYPSIAALEATQDRLHEKKLLQNLSIQCTPYFEMSDFNEKNVLLETLDYPFILKTRRMGYDGKGQCRIANSVDLINSQKKFDPNSVIIEPMIHFERELSIICVRDYEGKINYYPLIENVHEQGILRISKAPFVAPGLEKKARECAKKILTYFNYIGVLTIEFFQVGQNLLVNEIAPRVHNSGHWTIEGAQTSQFENHLRAICGFALGSTSVLNEATLFNFIGNQPDLNTCLKIKGAYYHTYGKEASPNRKLGHLTFVGDKQDPRTTIRLRKIHKLIF
jgi:5-(carboxyamino)imidazole ribonucleotide synthase